MKKENLSISHMLAWLKSNHMVLNLLVVIVVALVLNGVRTMQFDNHFDEHVMEEDPNSLLVEETSSIEEESVLQEIYVDVKGAVKRPNVYALPMGSRMFDLIDKAGGLEENAAVAYINLAQLLDDQMMVYIYTKYEILEQNNDLEVESNLSIHIGQVGSDSNETDHLININQATSNELEQLPNIGPKKAEAILQYRSENGSFQSPEELMNVSGIGAKTFEQLQALVTVGN